MGMFMASVSFRCADREKWMHVRPLVEKMFEDTSELVTNFEESGPGYVILDLQGYQIETLARLPERISALIGDYAVMAVCNDSDFDLMSLFYDGKCLEQSYIGEVYEEYIEFQEINEPDITLWIPLLQDPTRVEELKQSLYVCEIFAESNLRFLTELTGLPILDDELFLKYI